MKALSFSFALTLGLLAGFSLEARQVEIPFLSGPVIDEAQILSHSGRAQIEDLIRQSSGSVQFQVWTLRSLEGESIESVSIRAAETWKLGSAQKDNGVLILLSLNQRQIRIEVGQGLEGSVPDAMAGRIIDQIMVPHLRSRNYQAALKGAIMAINDLATGRPVPALESKRKGKLGFFELIMSLLVFGFGCFLAFRSKYNLYPNNPRGSRQGTWIGHRSSGLGGWGRGSWGGGGWSGGGGGFSGGGASGRW